MPKALIVTTAHKGVFFGYGEPSEEKTIRLERVRMCIYWPKDNHGVLGLAADGPKQGARIGPAAPVMVLQDVTSVIEVSPQAAKQWEKEPWQN